MLLVPWLLGFVATLREGGDILAPALLLACWMVGYFAFFAICQWLRSRMKPRYLPAVWTYSAVAAVLGGVLLMLRPEWLTWAVAFLPLVGLSLWLAWRRRDRSLLSGALTVAAASLLPMVMMSEGLWPWSVAPSVVGVALVCFGYFFGTVFYVKTIIRKRGKPNWVAASVLVHLQCIWGSLFLPGELPRVLLAGFFALMTARAWLVPLLGPMRGRNFSAKAVGIGEFGSTLLLLLILLMF